MNLHSVPSCNDLRAAGTLQSAYQAAELYTKVYKYIHTFLKLNYKIKRNRYVIKMKHFVTIRIKILA